MTECSEDSRTRVGLELLSEIAAEKTRSIGARKLAQSCDARDFLIFRYDPDCQCYRPLPAFVYLADDYGLPNIAAPSEAFFSVLSHSTSVNGEIIYRQTRLREGDSLFVFVDPLKPIPSEKTSDIFLLCSNLALILKAEFGRDTRETAYALELQKARDAAETANRAKSTFLANMSHEIRTPLGVMLGFARLIQDPLTPPEHDAYTRAILRNGSLLQQIFNDILDLSKVEAGMLELEMGNFYIRDLVQDILEVYKAGAKDKGLTMTLKVDDAVPSAIRSDARALRKILFNLLSNAIKFTAEGSIGIHLNMDDRGLLIIQVTDTGIGIDREDRENLFKPFFQVDSTNTRKFGGTGLGLALSRNLAESLGGELIILQSEPGKGTTFQTSLKVEVCELSRREERAEISAAMLQGKRILLVEDAQDVQMLMKRVLGRLGLQVVVADNGQIAVDLARAEYFDLVLMDMQMPLKDGLTATRELRDFGYERPIVALTANAFKEDKSLFLEAGCSAYLGKPIEFRKLKATIEAQLKLNNLGSKLNESILIAKEPEGRDRTIGH